MLARIMYISFMSAVFVASGAGCRSDAHVRGRTSAEADPPNRGTVCEGIRGDERSTAAYLDAYIDATFLALDRAAAESALTKWKEDGSPESQRSEILSYAADYNGKARAYNERVKKSGGAFTTADCLPSGVTQTLPAALSLIDIE